MARSGQTSTELLNKVTTYYQQSSGYNGLPLLGLLRSCKLTHKQATELLGKLVKRGKITVVFGDLHPNPHIKAFDEPTEDQLKKLRTLSLTYACVYPSHAHLTTVVDPSLDAGKPYSRSLALGTPQLESRAFDLSVLEYYRNDPRYFYKTDDIRGMISVKNEFYQSDQMSQQDQILLEHFGFCYDQKFNRAVAVFVRYLSNLSPEHQQLWKAKELVGDYRLHPDYYRTSILGEFRQKVSIFVAFVEELKIINQMAEAMGRPHFFRNDFTNDRAREFGFLVRPTLKDFNEFVLLLDKMISDNINKDFFMNEVPYEQEKTREDGKVIVQQKGTLLILAEWLQCMFQADDWTPIDEMLASFKAVRRRRQKPAHALDENVFDQTYFHQQRQLIKETYKGIRDLRLILATHPLASAVEIRPLVRDGKIWTF